MRTDPGTETDPRRQGLRQRKLQFIWGTCVMVTTWIIFVFGPAEPEPQIEWWVLLGLSAYLLWVAHKADQLLKELHDQSEHADVEHPPR